MKMYDGVIAKVRKIEQKNGIVYMDTDSVLYKLLKWLYVLAFAFSLVINSIYILGAYWREDTYITPLICTVSLILGLICLLKKWHIPAVVFTLPPAVIICLYFPHLLVYSNILNPKYYWAHLAPMIVLGVTVLGTAIIDTIAKLKFKKTYMRVINNLYSEYKVDLSQGEDVPEDKWEEFLESYDPYNYNTQIKKKKEADIEENT